VHEKLSIDSVIHLASPMDGIPTGADSELEFDNIANFRDVGATVNAFLGKK